MEVFVVTPIVLISILVTLVFLLKWADDNWAVGIQLFTAMIIMAVAVFGIFYLCMIWGWKSSEYKANIINREYNANYTKEEVFYGSDVIETIRELDRTRVELNGDLITK